MTSSFSAPTFTAFMAKLQQRQTPALLWYSAPGERIELSGRVLDNWVSKSANFLVDECEVDAGAHLTLTGQLHWRSIVLLLAALRTGATVSFEGGGGETQVQLSFSVDEIAASSAAYPVILDRGALSLRFMGQLPAGATDYCAEVRSHSDLYSGFSLPSDEGLAFAGLSYAQLMQQASQRAQALAQQPAETHALLLPATELSLETTVELLATLMAGFSLLLLDPEQRWTSQRQDRVLADERANAL